MDVRMFTVGPVAENAFIFRRDGSDRALIVDPGDEADKLLGGDRRARGEARRDPPHAHALRPRGRGGARGEGDRRRGVGAEARELRARGHQQLRALAGLRPVRVLRGRARAGGRRATRAGGLRDRRALHARAQPRPRDLLDPGRGRRSSPATCSSRARWGAPISRAATGARCSSRSGCSWTRSRRDGGLSRATWAPPPSAPSGRPTRSSPSWRASHGREAPGPAGDVRRPARGRQAPGRAGAHRRRRCSARAGYEPFESPVFEDTELFARGVGEATDIVRKEMFTFEDKAGRSLTLRPEGTAGVCRAYVEHGMHKLPQPVKLRYWGPFFRHEAPQAGRYRQFTQLGAEALGSDDPSLDAEIVLLLVELVEAVGARDITRAAVEPRHAGDARGIPGGAGRLPARARVRAVRGRARPAREQPAARVRRRPSGYPRGDGRGAPRLLDRLGPEDAEHFADGARPARRRGARLRGGHRARARARLLHAHGVRDRVGRARARRTRSAAAGATTGWWSSWAGPAPRAWASPPGVERILLAADGRPTSPGPAACTWPWPSPTRPAPRSRSRGSCASAACAWSSSRRGARSRAS